MLPAVRELMVKSLAKYATLFVLLASLVGVISDKVLNTTCVEIQFSVDVLREIELNSPSGTTVKVELNSLPSTTHITLNHYTEFSLNQLAFHQIAEGSRVLHEFGIQVFRSTNNTWEVRFLSNDPKFTGYYEVRIGKLY